MRIVAWLRDPNEDRGTIRRKLQAKHTAGQTNLVAVSDLDASMTLAARVLLMVSIGDFGLSVTIGQPILWESGPLQRVVDGVFEPATGHLETFRLPKIFNAVNLGRIAGIKVCWTSNLADHLLMNDDEGMVTLFHHVTFLKLHQKSDCLLLSDALISETILTLALLLPSNCRATRKYFEKCRARFSLDPAAGYCGHMSARARRIESFRHWKDRLTILKQAFDDSEPHTISSWWYDDRKRVQWYTFWIAALVFLLTVVFGTIQSITAVIQAWVAVKSIP
ncbi:hypothetical protein NA56DRAFT_582775 [Hyaloscypha hepaticicola]|uniref:Uncharacterized protein n=1 Tax=Hyaloscypha hepaticicola TaxID=2082293 RepID=A0A2J6PLM8_9HELO|nr:hypothetical protein NA56DRAFT_582775 [Hyaloscypha hepaticicola]